MRVHEKVVQRPVSEGRGWRKCEVVTSRLEGSAKRLGGQPFSVERSQCLNALRDKDTAASPSLADGPDACR